jgi:hypothetical protein
VLDETPAWPVAIEDGHFQVDPRRYQVAVATQTASGDACSFPSMMPGLLRTQAGRTIGLERLSPIPWSSPALSDERFHDSDPD